MKVYVASSWRNPMQPEIVAFLRNFGHEVYDFRHPREGDHGFSWGDIAAEWQGWTAKEYIAALSHPIAEAGFKSDMDALRWCDTCVLVLPCGRSAHLEAGWATGAGKRVIVLTKDGEEPELMAKMCYRVVENLTDLLDAIQDPRP